MTLRTRYSVQSHVGLKRKVNEDAVLALPELNIWVVSDGMGGHAAGDYASRLIADMAAGIPLDLAPGDRLQALRDTLHEAHRLIRAEAASQGIDVIGATVVALLLAEGHFAALWAGDSRLYRLRDGEIEMLTTDHSVVAALVEAGHMSWDEAEHHPQSNAITRAVGVGDELELEKIKGDILPGDRFLICSDGLTKYATFEMLRKSLSEQPIEVICDHLIQIALAGGGGDNITTAVIDII
ncbi:PP2C family protein-serine/threonine phosphatase [Sulfitobacter geojensis]|jgi:serine/threonine protein phosphatase PrpC|uniref:Serine/threonine-protein phosphatase n=1 Tax=Sulfitobacter geojensis TaxID=1342299 RepID=A0AAE2VYJ0_9RHOB|nr:protein phosphatase 2C domain-containing protein [Sulfitobacter geojensis]KHA50833.1 Ser/Thr protein phosphatase [Sulfitobacter geojensis]MBM1689843.1 serine/threonine-protein phosphatase [Sulfitobacter geojensis]MBM1693909.1 serine/threonine-protein phosphatase [Sulfitobacter geojensis]MBM1706075.1 serine/threonine-protein phosphatase [Sulfitobacter geojensis]MBM1710133.1 serine/threonine-protein phosphatase [Sulfitobacter geojensis]